MPRSTTDVPGPRCRVRQPGSPARVEDVAPPAVYDPRFAAVLKPGAALMSLYDQAVFSEGPVWWPERQMLVWSDIEGRRVFGWHPDGAVDVVVDATAFINGNALDADGRLIHCEHGRRCISRTDARCETVPLAAHFEGKRLNSPNDVVLGPDGALWFTDPTYGLTNPRQGCPAEPELDHRSVYRFHEASGTLTRMVDLEQPNGLAFSPDGQTLYVSDTDEERHHIVAFTVGADGALSGRRVFRVIEPGLPDGFKVDARGWVWTSSGSGVQVFSADGDPLGLIPTPRECTNLAFGGPDGRRLFVTGGESLWAIDLAR
ncbi:MAG TPA: SMP-30/gluconolactonase/LRE family protein [Longimicrobium sp.]|nr:SMP-30/gluconolactonase/LRE family protein [Longimicrobium sp.]